MTRQGTSNICNKEGARRGFVLERAWVQVAREAVGPKDVSSPSSGSPTPRRRGLQRTTAEGLTSSSTARPPGARLCAATPPCWELQRLSQDEQAALAQTDKLLAAVPRGAAQADVPPHGHTDGHGARSHRLQFVEGQEGHQVCADSHSYLRYNGRLIQRRSAGPVTRLKI